MVQIQVIANEYRNDLSELQIQMSQLISSTLVHLKTQNNVNLQRQRRLYFRDTFSIQYPQEVSSEANDQSAAINTDKQY